MDTNVVALKNLYVAFGGSADDVAEISTIADMINALCTVVVAGGAGLPAVTAEDNGKVLKVVDGEWAVGTDEISA
jgi:carbamate kinase